MYGIDYIEIEDDSMNSYTMSTLYGTIFDILGIVECYHLGDSVLGVSLAYSVTV